MELPHYASDVFIPDVDAPMQITDNKRVQNTYNQNYGNDGDGCLDGCINFIANW